MAVDVPDSFEASKLPRFFCVFLYFHYPQMGMVFVVSWVTCVLWFFRFWLVGRANKKTYNKYENNFWSSQVRVCWVWSNNYQNGITLTNPIAISIRHHPTPGGGGGGMGWGVGDGYCDRCRQCYAFWLIDRPQPTC